MKAIQLQVFAVRTEKAGREQQWQTLAEVPGQKVPSTMTAKWGWAMPSNGPALADPANWG